MKKYILLSALLASLCSCVKVNKTDYNIKPVITLSNWSGAAPSNLQPVLHDTVVMGWKGYFMQGIFSAANGIKSIHAEIDGNKVLDKSFDDFIRFNEGFNITRDFPDSSYNSTWYMRVTDYENQTTEKTIHIYSIDTIKIVPLNYNREPEKAGYDFTHNKYISEYDGGNQNQIDIVDTKGKSGQWLSKNITSKTGCMFFKLTGNIDFFNPSLTEADVASKYDAALAKPTIDFNQGDVILCNLRGSGEFMLLYVRTTYDWSYYDLNYYIFAYRKF